MPGASDRLGLARSDAVLLYDTTLRDGMQGEGMSLSVDEKVRVAHALDSLGVHLIEAGFPASNPKEEALFELLAGESFDNAELVAFGMTRRRDAAAEDDPALRLLADGFAPVCTLVGKTWSLHLEKVTQVEPEENLRMIADSVGFLVSQGKRVIYDAEHFFDGFRADPAYALRCLRAAAEAGADTVVVCDTNGATLPGAVAEASARSAGSSSARAPRRRVMPNAHTSARRRSCSSRSNSSASFGLLAGNPASTYGMPRPSSTCATRTFSSTDSDIP